MNFSEAFAQIKGSIRHCMFSPSTLKVLRWSENRQFFLLAYPNELAWYQHLPGIPELLAEDWQRMECPTGWKNEPNVTLTTTTTNGEDGR